MKKYISLIFMFIFMPLFFCGCGDIAEQQPDNVIKLSTPTNLCWEDNLIQWDPVYNASSYIVSINDKEYESFINSATLIVEEHVYNYNIKVKARTNNKNYEDSEYSSPFYINLTKLDTPIILQNFKSNYNGEYGTLLLEVNPNTDFIKIEINDNEYVYDVENIYELKITKDMCISGINTLYIQACSYNKIYLDSEVCSTTVLKNYEPTNICVENEQILFTKKDVYGNIISDSFCFNEPIYQIGEIDVPVINYSNDNALSSDPVLFKTYKIQGIDSTTLLQYKKNQNGWTDFYLKKVYNDYISGNNYNMIRIHFYDRGGKILYTFYANIQNDPYRNPEFGMSSFSPYDVGKVTATLINTNETAYLTTEVQIKFKDASAL